MTFDLNLYADFTYNEYTVTYVDAKYNTKIDDLKVKYENPYTLSTIENQPGWTFSGWKTDDGELFDNLGTYRFTSDLILYAYWTANQYRITLDPNQGYVSSTEITVTYDSEYELPAPTRTNYTFLGWYDKNDSKVSSKDIWKQTEDVTYTAKWTGDKHTYTFDPGEGTCVLDSMVIGWEQAYELPTPNAPTSDASEGLTYKYTFEGWYLNDTLIPQSGTSWTYSDADGTLVAKYVVADSMTYGIYPQTHVSDNTLISALDSLMTPESNGWYLYDGDYYAKASAKLYASGYMFTDGTGITHGKTYWYKCEPITWKVLSYEDGTCFLVSTKVLDVQQYDSSSNNYKNSGVRSWLNDTFYATAFSLGNSYIQNVEVDNSASTTISSNNSNACENTYDNVYLLSYRDYVNASYFADNVSRCFKITDWVIANGMCVINNNENGLYWTRSPTNLSSSNVSRVFNNGVIGNDTMNSTCNGVCPAITIKL